MYISHADIIEAIENGEGTRDEFDIQGIQDEMAKHEEVGGEDRIIDEDAFWAAVERHVL